MESKSGAKVQLFCLSTKNSCVFFVSMAPKGCFLGFSVLLCSLFYSSHLSFNQGKVVPKTSYCPCSSHASFPTYPADVLPLYLTSQKRLKCHVVSAFCKTRSSPVSFCILNRRSSECKNHSSISPSATSSAVTHSSLLLFNECRLGCARS